MINQNSLAAGNLVSVKNVQFQPGAQVLQRKIAIIGTFDPSKTSVVENELRRIFSAEEAASLYGDGSMIHRLAKKAFVGSLGVETWIVPQAEEAGGTQATGKIAFTGPATSSATIGVYIAGEKFAEVNIASGASADDIAAAIVAALDASSDNSSPLTQAVNGVNANEIDFTAKMKGTYGNDVDLSLNLEEGEGLPAGVGATVTPMASGATDPDISDALNALGTGDNQNENFFTALIHGYSQVTAVLDAISTYNGVGNDFSGNYKKEVARPFRSLSGDVAPGSGGLSALVSLADGRKEDRTNGVFAAPGSENHPAEIAALVMGSMEAINSNRAEETYIDIVLSSIRAGDDSERWTNTYDNRDTAVKNGISTSLFKNGALTIQNVVSFYRPDSVPQESNGYRSMRNISIIQNVLFNQKLTFEQDKWKGITIVADVTKVGNATSKLKARDVNSVLDELVGLALEYESNAWIFAASFTIDELKEGDKVVLRPAGNGFDITFPIVLSGEGGILNQVVEFDTSLAVFL